MEARVINPSGIPIPAPIAASRETLEQPLDVSEGFEDWEPFTARPATPGMAVPVGTLTDLKFPQLTLPFFHEAVPQQWTVLLPLYWAATIGNPAFSL
jgi:hypothetical protein